MENKRKFKFIAIVLAVMFFLTGGITVYASIENGWLDWTGADELIESKEIVIQLVTDINIVEAERALLEIERDDLLLDVAANEAEIASLNAQIAALDIQILDLQSEIADLDGEVAWLQNELTTANADAEAFRNDVCAAIDALPPGIRDSGNYTMCD